MTECSSQDDMSGGLMSCVRENSPPLEMDINVSGPLSLPEPSINNSDLMGSVHSSSHHNIASSTPLAAQISSHLDGSSSSGGGGGGGCGSGGGAACSTPIATPPNTVIFQVALLNVSWEGYLELEKSADVYEVLHNTKP
ncbi:hypothetical protein DOY81_006787 [Sarcophaga bullata]|nr:hypothetical protein DOY81_006787 [Sarcophaga bullata]